MISFRCKANLSADDIEAFSRKRELLLRLKTNLKTAPPNIHWHFQRHQEKGTLEITLFKDDVEVCYKENRFGAWLPEEMAAWKSWLT